MSINRLNLSEDIKMEMVYDPTMEELEKEMADTVSGSKVSLTLNQQMGITVDGLEVKAVSFKNGVFEMKAGDIPPGLWRYTQWWVNKRSRKALLTKREKKYFYYYKQSWTRYTFNYWPKETPSEAITITHSIPGDMV